MGFLFSGFVWMVDDPGADSGMRMRRTIDFLEKAALQVQSISYMSLLFCPRNLLA